MKNLPRSSFQCAGRRFPTSNFIVTLVLMVFASVGLCTPQWLTSFDHAFAAATPTAPIPPPPVSTSNPISVTGFNQDVVVDSNPISSSITATMDLGTAKTGNTFYSVGYNTGAPKTGLPMGTIFASAASPNIIYQLQSATGNNALVLDNTTPATTGTLTLATPAAYSQLSFLSASAFGPGVLAITLHFSDGAPDVTGLTINVPDWFNGTPVALSANGRVDNTGSFSFVNAANPRLYDETITVPAAATGHPIASIKVDMTGGIARYAIFAVSGIPSATPSSTPVGTVPDQGLAPGQTSILDLAKYLSDPATTNGTVVSFNTSQGAFNVSLFDKDAPQTVTNFLDYIQAGRYNNDVFHRLSNISQTGPANPAPTPYQVLQGGGFGVIADSSNNVAGFSTVTTFQPIENETSDLLHPNAVGTLSMSRNSPPNSATSQFFFNLTDNSQMLGQINGGGYTVFGAVTDNTGLNALHNFATNYTPADVSTATGKATFFAFPLINGFTPASNFPVGSTTSDLAIINSIIVTSGPTGALTYALLSNSNPSVVTATLGSNTVGSQLSANQLQLVDGGSPGSSVITLFVNDKANQPLVKQFTVVVDTAPTISGATIVRSQGGTTSNSQIGTVSDSALSPAALTLTINGGTSASVNGVTVSNLVADNTGKITADVVAGCAATDASFTLKAANAAASATATLNVTVTPNSAPTLVYPSPVPVTGMGSASITPATATDNGSITGFVVQSVSPALTTTPTVNGSGVVSISNAFPAGTHTITIRATDNCGAFTDASFSLAVGKTDQTITFGSLASKTFLDPDFQVSATASSGLPVSLAASGNCTVTTPSPGTVHLTGGGACTITASQGGDANYNAATAVPQPFAIAKANQTITFNAVANKTFGDSDFPVSGTASSGLAVSLAAAGNCSVTTPSPATVHITGAGSCTITASQAGDANYNPAASVPQSFNIAVAATVTALSSSINPADLNQPVTFTATVSSASALPTGTVQFKDNGTNLGSPVALNAGVAQLSTSTLTAGTHTITADYPGAANYGASSGTLSGGQVVKSQATLSINDVSLAEGDSGTQTMNFTVTLSAASNLTVSVNFATADVSATAPSDYAPANGTLTFNPGETTKTIPVTINGDVNFEPDETFTVNLSSATNAGISKGTGTGTIKNDDPLGGVISLSQANYNVAEANGVMTVTINRTKDTRNPVTVDYATDDSGAPADCGTLNSGLASSRCDFTAMLGTLNFAANETQKTIDISINRDGYAEGDEVFKFNLSNPTGGAILSSPSSATITITDSQVPSANAIDDTDLFVRQQYHDFLNREPDPSGLAFWIDNIEKCNDPARIPLGQTVARCIETQRTITSASFFLSIEFRQTGGLVRDFYVAALDRPATNNMPNFVEFMRDTQATQRGVVVGQGNWQAQLTTNRAAFMNAFVMRPEFVGLYPTTDTPTQYVDKLYLHANVTPGSAQERTDAISEFGGAATAADPGARGRGLLRITQNAAFQARELNRGFVQLEYFGYLRRNPNDPPDNNFNGYNFWLNKLNQFNGDFLQAEMVKAFLTATEYRHRFGP